MHQQQEDGDQEVLLIATAAQGTRGDVQPVAALAWHLAHHLSRGQQQRVHLTLITHASHKGLLDQLQLEFGAGTGRSLQLQFISAPPAAVWESQQQGLGAQPAASAPSGINDKEAVTRAELLQHCCQALQLPLPDTAAAGAEGAEAARAAAAALASQHHGSQRQQQQKTAKKPPQRLLLFNLFAQELFSIAEALQVPCCVVQPYCVPYNMPSGFERRFQQAAPALAAQLDVSAAGESSSPGVASLSFKDVRHWMWPLFTERWGPWRQEALGLQPWPLAQALQEHWQGVTFASTAASSSEAPAGQQPLPAAATAATAATATARQGLPSAVPVLYGLSPAVVTQPGFWPPSVHLCGFWLTSQLHQHQQQQCGLPAALQAFIYSCRHSDKQAGKPQQPQEKQQQECLWVVDFGSMGALGLLRDADTLLRVLLHALLLLGPQWKCVLITGGWAPLLQAQQTLLAHCETDTAQPAPSDAAAAGLQEDDAAPAACHGQQQQQQHVQQHAQQLLAALPRLFVQHESLACHHLLLEAAAVLLHHAGSGTTAAALAAGVPQLAIPLQFDQFFWAERVSDLGCSPGSVAADQLMPPAAAAAVPAAAGVEACPTTVQSQAGSYLAAQVLAARQPHILQACRQLKEELAKEDGLQAATASVQLYLCEVYGAGGAAV